MFWNVTLTGVINSYSASHDNWCTATLWNRIMTAQCEGMGEVGSARYEPALLPPCPSIRALCYSNCQRSTQSHQQSKGYILQCLSGLLNITNTWLSLACHHSYRICDASLSSQLLIIAIVSLLPLARCHVDAWVWSQYLTVANTDVTDPEVWSIYLTVATTDVTDLEVWSIYLTVADTGVI